MKELTTSKSKAITAYRALSKAGNLIAARLVLRLLQRRRVTLGRNDDDWLADLALEREGLVASISSRSFNATYTISN